MAEAASEYYLIHLPGSLSSTLFSEYVEKKLAHCLKNRFDNVIMDISRLVVFERVPFEVITRWIRNLKSLGGTLTIVGVTPELEPAFRSSKVRGACETFLDLKEFQARNPNVSVKLDEDVSASEPQTEQAPDQSTEDQDEGRSEAVASASSEESSEISLDDTEDGLTEESAESPGAGNPEEEPEEEPVKDAPGLEPPSQPAQTEGSITGSIDIRKLEKMGMESDVSDKLDFLKQPPRPGTAASEAGRPEEGKEEAAGEVEEQTSEAQEEEAGLDGELTEVRGTEMFYNISGDTTEGEGEDLDNQLLDDLGEVDVDEDIFKQDEEETAEQAEGGEEAVDEGPAGEPEGSSSGPSVEEAAGGGEVKPEEATVSETETGEEEVTEERGAESYYNILGDEAEGGSENLDQGILDDLNDVEVDEKVFQEETQGEVQEPAEAVGGEQEADPSATAQEPEALAAEEGEKPETGGVKKAHSEELESVGTMIKFSGEYQCQSCGISDHFCKGYRFHSCTNKSCEEQDRGWRLILVLF